MPAPSLTSEPTPGRWIACALRFTLLGLAVVVVVTGCGGGGGSSQVSTPESWAGVVCGTMLRLDVGIRPVVRALDAGGADRAQFLESLRLAHDLNRLAAATLMALPPPESSYAPRAQSEVQVYAHDLDGLVTELTQTERRALNTSLATWRRRSGVERRQLAIKLAFSAAVPPYLVTRLGDHLGPGRLRDAIENDPACSRLAKEYVSP